MTDRYLRTTPPHIVLKTRLGEIVQDEVMFHSETLTDFFTDDEDFDVLDGIATNYDLDTVRQREVDEVRREFLAGTQKALIARGLGEILTVYRYGPVRTHQVSDVTSVTLDPYVAVSGARREWSIAQEYRVARSDVLLDVTAFWPTDSLDEEELLVRPEDLELVGYHYPAKANPEMRRNPTDRQLLIEDAGRALAWELERGSWIPNISTFVAEYVSYGYGKRYEHVADKAEEKPGGWTRLVRAVERQAERCR
jgi:hypothetical protein